MKTQHPIRSLCAVLEVSSSGYYDWVERQTQPGPRAQENVQLAAQILQIHQSSRKTYGRLCGAGAPCRLCRFPLWLCARGLEAHAF